MSRQYYPPHSSPPGEDEFNFDATMSPHLAQQPHVYQNVDHSMMPLMSQQQMYSGNPHYYNMNPAYSPHLGYSPAHTPQWTTPVVPSNYGFASPPTPAFAVYSEPQRFSTDAVYAGPSTSATRYLSPEEAVPDRSSRAESFTSNASSVSPSDLSRSVSPNVSEMSRWGHRNQNGTWSCSYPGCSSRSTFNRGCDLRKHYKRHTKSLFCRHKGCPQATEGGFSSKKDRARHEASHNPRVVCEWDGCDRKFSRVDNMKDHVRRMHRRGPR